MKSAKLRVIDMALGYTYNVSDLGRCASSKCPCCGKAIKAHERVVCVPAPDKGAQGCKTIVGLDCEPEIGKHPEWDDTLEIRYTVFGRNKNYARGALMYATRNYASREIDETADGFILTLYKDELAGCQQFGKLPACIGAKQVFKPVAMSINGNDWQEYDSAVVTDTLGFEYRGLKKYGV